eukprot:6173557-Pleurochrysis_carterae.AAC.1
MSDAETMRMIEAMKTVTISSRPLLRSTCAQSRRGNPKRRMRGGEGGASPVRPNLSCSGEYASRCTLVANTTVYPLSQ